MEMATWNQGQNSKERYPGVKVQQEIRDNGRKKLIIIGKTGSGKSSLCNVITGYGHDADIFPVTQSCTQRTKFADVYFNGDKTYPISLIDTIGFDDATKNDDAAIIAELVSKLNNDCDHINLFAIAVNGQNSRLDGSLVHIIRIFEIMFTIEFWKQVVIIFTRVPQDDRTKTKRERMNKKSDDDLAVDFMKVVEEHFPNGKGLQYLYLDACYDKNDDDENTAFLNALRTLRQLLKDNTGLTTASIRQVETQNETLKRQIEKHEKARKEAENGLKEAVENMGRRVQEDKEKFEAEMRRMIDEQNEKMDEERRITETQNETLRRQIKEHEKARKEAEDKLKAAEDKFKEAVDNLERRAREDKDRFEAEMQRMIDEQNAEERRRELDALL